MVEVEPVQAWPTDGLKLFKTAPQAASTVQKQAKAEGKYDGGAAGRGAAARGAAARGAAARGAAARGARVPAR